MSASIAEETTEMDKHLGSLVSLSRSILKTYRSKTSFVNTRDPILACLNNYDKLFDGTNPAEHADFFLLVFNAHRKGILKGTINATEVKWLKDENVIVQFGQGITKKPDPNYRIYLGTIFIRALSLADKANAELGNKQVDEDDAKKFPELDYPSLFILNLYRVFRGFLSDKEEIAGISKHIKRLEEILDLDDGESKEASTASAQQGLQGLQGLLSSSGSGGINGLIGAMMGMMGAPASSSSSSSSSTSASLGPSGGEVKESGSMPLPQDIGKIFESLLKNKGTQEIFSKIAADANNCNSINDVFTTLGKSLQETDLQGIVKGVMEEASGSTSTSVSSLPLSLPSSSQIVNSVVTDKKATEDKADKVESGAICAKKEDEND